MREGSSGLGEDAPEPPHLGGRLSYLVVIGNNNVRQGSAN